MKNIVRRGRSELPRLSEGAGAGGGDREPYQRTAGATGLETEEEGLERAMDESRRPGCTHHEDEGWTHASVAQGRTCGRPVERRRSWLSPYSRPVTATPIRFTGRWRKRNRRRARSVNVPSRRSSPTRAITAVRC